MISVSVIIVNYNVRHFLSRCLDSILRCDHRDGFRVEVIVVDNNSTDESFPFLTERYGDQVEFIRNNKNVGFGSACNQGARIASGKYLLFLNPDTLVPKNIFEDCYNYLEAENNINVAAVGVKIIDGAGDFLPESKRAFPTVWNSFCKLSGISKLFPQSKLFGGYNLQYLSPHSDHSVDVLCGAFMMIRKKVFEEVGGFDEKFFMYGEDIDLCYRIKSLGYKIHYKSDSHIVHFKGESSKKKDIKYYSSFYRAMSIYASKHYSLVTAFFLKSAIFLASIFSLGLKVCKSFATTILDFLVLMITFQVVKFMWAKWKFNSWHYYEYPRMYLLSFFFVLLLIASLFLAGYYKKLSTFRNLFTGVFFGGLFILAIYGLLPLDWRFSRAVLLLFIPFSAIILLFTSAITNYLKTGRFTFLSYRKKKLVFVGKSELFEKLQHLVNNTNEKLQLLGRIAFAEENESSHYLGHVDQLPQLIDQYEIDELVFGIVDDNFDVIFTLLNRYGSKIRFKILGNDGLSIIGSNNPARAGDVYLIDMDYKIKEGSSIFFKWIFDKVISVFVLILFPIIYFYNNNLLKYGIKVLFIGYTWVGYDELDDELSKLPSLKKGIIANNYKSSSIMTSKDRHLHNLQYAKNYSVFTDMDILFYFLFKNK